MQSARPGGSMRAPRARRLGHVCCLALHSLHAHCFTELSMQPCEQLEASSSSRRQARERGKDALTAMVRVILADSL